MWMEKELTLWRRARLHKKAFFGELYGRQLCCQLFDVSFLRNILKEINFYQLRPFRLALFDLIFFCFLPQASLNKDDQAACVLLYFQGSLFPEEVDLSWMLRAQFPPDIATKR